MGSLVGRMGAGTASLSDATSGNGTAVSVAGAHRVLIHMTTSATLTAGAVRIQESMDEGLNWANVTDLVEISNADGAAGLANGEIVGTSFPRGGTFKIGHRSGDVLVRAIVQTALTGGNATVRIIPVGL